jgi:hypothetical protein
VISFRRDYGPEVSLVPSSHPFKNHLAGLGWVTPVILATQEAEIRSIAVRSQPWRIVCETPISENKKGGGAGGVAQGVGPEFKPQYPSKKNHLTVSEVSSQA